MERSALAPSVSLSVAELLPGVGSVTPAGAVTVAVLLSVPVAAAHLVQLAVWVALAPLGRLALPVMFPAPEGVEVPEPAAPQVPVQLSDPGKLSSSLAAGSSALPALEAVMV